MKYWVHFEAKIETPNQPISRTEHGTGVELPHAVTEFEHVAELAGAIIAKISQAGAVNPDHISINVFAFHPLEETKLVLPPGNKWQ